MISPVQRDGPDTAAGRLRVLGWAEDDRSRPFALEAQELVNHAIESCLAGERRWVPGTGATEQGLVAFLCEIMRSIAVNRRTSAAIARRAGGDALEQEMDERPTPSRDFATRDLLSDILDNEEEAVDFIETPWPAIRSPSWVICRTTSCSQRNWARC